MSVMGERRCLEPLIALPTPALLAAGDITARTSRSQSRSHAYLFCVLPHGFSRKFLPTDFRGKERLLTAVYSKHLEFRQKYGATQCASCFNFIFIVCKFNEMLLVFDVLQRPSMFIVISLGKKRLWRRIREK